MKHNVPVELYSSYSHSLALSLASLANTADLDKATRPDMEDLITKLEEAYDALKKALNIRQEAK